MRSAKADDGDGGTGEGWLHAVCEERWFGWWWVAATARAHASIQGAHRRRFRPWTGLPERRRDLSLRASSPRGK